MARRRRGDGADDDSSGGDQAEGEFYEGSNPALPESAKKSTCVAYLYYCTFGWLGMHHFYLGRDYHGFVTVTTFGRFGLGILLDLLFIPTYVAEANDELDRQYLWRRQAQRAKGRCALLSCSMATLSRITLQYLTSYFYMVLVQHFLGQDVPYLDALMTVLEPLAAAAGVWLVGNIGATRLSFMPVYAVAQIASAALYFTDTADLEGLLPIAGVVGALVCGELRPRQQRSSMRRSRQRGLCRRALNVGLGLTLLAVVWTGVVLMNAEVTSEDGQKITLYDALRNFYNSPAWDETLHTFGKLYEEATRERGDFDDEGTGQSDDRWERFFSKFKDVFDVDGEHRALMDLGLPLNATDGEVKAAHRKLAKQYHPDRNPGKQQEASDKFMKIQEAYETLQRIRDLRKKGARAN